MTSPKRPRRMTRREWVRLLAVMLVIAIIGVLIAAGLGGSGTSTQRSAGPVAVQLTR